MDLSASGAGPWSGLAFTYHTCIMMFVENETFSESRSFKPEPPEV